MELGSHTELERDGAGLSQRTGPSFASGFNGCFSDTVFVTVSSRRAVETAISEVHKLPLHIGGVPTSLTLLFWRWLTVSSLFSGRGA